MDSWQKANQDYLAAALAWLRLRLARLTESVTGTAGPEPAPRRCFFGSRKRAETVSASSAASSIREGKATRAETEAATRMARLASTEPPPALVMLSRRFGLSPFEQEVLLLCVAMELDPGTAALCARAQDDPGRTHPTLALAMALFDDPSWDVLSPDRPLRYWRLIESAQSGAQPLTTSPVRADERIVSYIKGLSYLDDRLVPLLLPLETDPGGIELAPSQQATADAIMRRLGQVAAGARPPVVQLTGTDGLSKQLIIEDVTSRLGLHPYRLPAGLLPAPAAELDTLARLWQRECLLMPVVLHVDASDLDEIAQPGTGIPAGDSSASPLNRFLSRSNCLVFLDTRDARQGLAGATITVDCDRPTPVEQRATWASALGAEQAGDSPALLSGQFNLNVSTIWQIARTALSEPPENRQNLHDRLWEDCLVRARPRLDILAQRLDPKARWENIVLPEEQEHLLREIAGQVGQRSLVYDQWGFRRAMNRGLGISALFAGETGTGKTMAAEVIANHLRLSLYRIDLSAVVSKYIGETEKNLRRLFDAAEDGGAILFFDEADALFGKRSEVKDSHDRYANIEINYLLQRIESYRGLAILATNMKSALDRAFLRRLRFVVNFPFPGPRERKAIWEKVFPAEAPVAGLDCDRLARLNLTGGSIHSIALNAAFQAAEAGAAVTMETVLRAARTELRKLEKPIDEAEFHWREPAGAMR